MVLATVPGVASAKTQVGPTVVVDRGETVSDDLTMAAGTILILGTVDGDVTALAGDVIVAGEVTGDVTALAGRIEVTGTVGGKVTALGGVTSVAGTVGDGIDTIGGALTVSGDVSGTVDAISVLVTVEDDATITGRLETTAVRTLVNGSVLGGEDSQVTQSPGGATNSSRVSGPRSALVSTMTESTVIWSATLGLKPPTALALGPLLVPAQILPFGISFLDAYGFFVNLLLGVILVGVLPQFSTRVAAAIVRYPVRSAGFGLATTIGAPIVLILLGVSLFGLPLALAGGAIFLVLWWVGAIYGRVAVGVWILESVPRLLAAAGIEREPIQNKWASLFVGVFVVGLLVSLPAIGAVVDTGVAVLGVGALVHLAYRAYDRTERTEQRGLEASGPHRGD
ncbi:bactofilin family protein [Haloferax sp. DFSO52]|uniref:bactofilin family protein n=1 Tax=Haloferax sp. DFSO52 TaxID=3388505 RepID=UPI003A8582D8